VGYLDEVNRIAIEEIMPKMLEQVFKGSPVLDFLKRNDLSSVYACAERYGYKSPYGPRPYMSEKGWK